MSAFVTILLIILALAAAYLLRRAKSKAIEVNIIDKEQYGQPLFNPRGHKAENKEMLSFQERVELSWAFLTNISERVLEHFSYQDQQTVQRVGEILTQNGAQYQHNINNESKLTLAFIKGLEKNKEQSFSR